MKRRNKWINDGETDTRRADCNSSGLLNTKVLKSEHLHSRIINVRLTWGML